LLALDGPRNDARSLVPDVDARRYDEYAELFVSATDVARAARDESGRPLGERYLPPRLTENVVFELRASRYPGSRLGRPINVSALEAISRHWRGVLTDVGVLRERYAARHEIVRLSWLDVWQFARTVTAAPALLLRAPQPPSALPTRLAALFKPAIGLYMTAERAVLGGEEPLAAPAVDEFVELTERTGAFLSRDAACSGTPRMVADFVSAVLDGSAGYPDDGWLARLLHPGRALDYGEAVSRLELAKALYLVELLRELLPDAGEGDSSSPPPPFAFKGIDVEAHRLPELRGTLAGLFERFDGRPPPAAAPEGAWTELFERLQAEASAAAGRPPPSLALSARDLARMVEYLVSTWESTEAGGRLDLRAALAQAAGAGPP
jgi:hypothetical protein